MTEEQCLMEKIAMLQHEYQQLIDPYVQRLVRIQAMNPVPPIFVPIESLPLYLKESLTIHSGESK